MSKYTKIYCIVGLALLVGGCQGPWEAFEEIQIGKLVPVDSIFGQKQKAGLVKKCDDTEEYWLESSRLIPFCANKSLVMVDCDKEGVVKAKAYSAVSTTDLVITHITAIRWVSEMTVPRRGKDGRLDLGNIPFMLPYVPEENCLIGLSLLIVPYYLQVICVSSPGELVDRYPGFADELGKNGFYLEHRSPNSWNTTIKNIGNGRIRIEKSTFRIGPPLWSLWMILSGSVEGEGTLMGPGELRVNGKIVEPVLKARPAYSW